MSESFDIAINRFSDHLKFEKRYSVHTLRSYQDDLHQFRDYLVIQMGGMEFDAISSPIVRSWLASLKEQKLSSRSISRKISSLKSFFKFLMRTGLAAKSPMVNISSPKNSKKLPTFVEEQDMATLFAHVKFDDDWNGYTARLVMNMLYQAGLRLSELVNFREMQVDYSNGHIKVLGKGNKERIIPVVEQLLTSIKEYRDRKRKTFESYDSVYLLVNDKGKKLYPKYVYRLTNKYLQEVTTIVKKSPHILRHSFATHLSNNGAELNAVKDLLGHASLAATQVYTHNSIGKLKSVHKTAHPRG